MRMTKKKKMKMTRNMLWRRSLIKRRPRTEHGSTGLSGGAIAMKRTLGNLLKISLMIQVIISHI